MKKRFFAMFLATAMALSLVSISAANVSVSSTASNPKTDISPKTASEIVALSFMKNSLNSNIEISETTPFYDFMIWMVTSPPTAFLFTSLKSQKGMSLLVS